MSISAVPLLAGGCCGAPVSVTLKAMRLRLRGTPYTPAYSMGGVSSRGRYK
jgi:hypothetical protein